MNAKSEIRKTDLAALEEPFSPNPVPFDVPISYLTKESVVKQKSRRKWHCSWVVPLPSVRHLPKIAALALFAAALFSGWYSLKAGQEPRSREFHLLLAELKRCHDHNHFRRFDQKLDNLTRNFAVSMQKTVFPAHNGALQEQHSPATRSPSVRGQLASEGNPRLFKELTGQVPVVVKSRMGADLEREVFGAAKAAFSVHQDWESVARQIKRVIQNQHKGAWHCVVGPQFGAFVSASSVPNSYIEFLVGRVRVELFRTS